MNAAAVTWACVMAILAAAAIGVWQSNRRWHQAQETFRRQHQDRLSHLIHADHPGTGQLTRELHDEGNQNCAWPPGTQAPHPSVHKPVAARTRCGCIYLDGALWQPCTREALVDHINQHADQWAARLTEEN